MVNGVSYGMDTIAGRFQGISGCHAHNLTLNVTNIVNNHTDEITFHITFTTLKEAIMKVVLFIG